MDPSEATRDVYWNIRHVWVMYVLFAVTLGIALYGIYRRVRKWRCGQPANRLDRPLQRLRRLFQHAVLQQATWRDRYAGALHAMLFWGMVTLTIATTVVFVHHDFDIRIMQGRFYLYFQSLFVDFAGVVALVGVGMAAVRRWFGRPDKLIYSNEGTWILVILFMILATGYLLEGWRILVTDDPWKHWSPVGFAIGRISMTLASGETWRLAHVALWWFHLVLAFGLIAWVPYTKLMHMVTTPLNIYTSHLDGVTGSLKTVDFDNAPSLGVNSLEQFTWKDLLDLDSCTECGRCHDVCPASTVGKLLSPRDIIMDLQSLLRKSDLASLPADSAEVGGEAYRPAVPVIGRTPALSAEALWQCTTCGACVECCPVAIEQLPKIVDLRRFQVMEEADFPPTMEEAISSLEQRGHPFRGTRFSRLDWATGLDVATIAEVENPEILLWVGCGGALVERNHRTIRALAQLLTTAGVKFAILGREETCTGDLARRVGNELLFERLATKNIETFRRHAITQIVTACPHCFHTFKNEYPRFGSRLEVFHHTAYLAMLIAAGRLKCDASATEQIAFHDPCYLSRYNQITEAPRELVRRTTNRRLREMPQNGLQTFCCGGGGGMSFVEEVADQRVNQERARQALATGADTVAVACPFCMAMMEDGVNAAGADRQVAVKDVAEILWEAVSGDRS
ncbi:MAG: heterodisulfide reductase-related iron-sulfur binding cluster [Pirellulaceae bacterium]